MIMDLIEKLRQQSFKLENLPFLTEAYLFGAPNQPSILLVTNHPLGPREKHEAKSKVKDIFWETPLNIRITTKNQLVAQTSRREGLGRIFDQNPHCLFRRSSF